jgi:hypothetical protein
MAARQTAGQQSPARGLREIGDVRTDGTRRRWKDSTGRSPLAAAQDIAARDRVARRRGRAAAAAGSPWRCADGELRSVPLANVQPK